MSERCGTRAGTTSIRGGRIIFLFKHGTMFTVVVSVEPKVGGLGVRRGVLLEVTFMCTRILENKACLKTS